MIAISILLLGWLTTIALVDVRTHRIPDRLSLPLIGCGLVWSAMQGAHPWPSYAIGAAAGFASLAAFGELFFRRYGHEGLGLGDAKLFAAGGAWLGWQTLPILLALAALAGLSCALLMRRRRGEPLAFGPWLALGIWICWLLGWR